jgi:ankyrin repeat protein
MCLYTEAELYYTGNRYFPGINTGHITSSKSNPYDSSPIKIIKSEYILSKSLFGSENVMKKDCMISLLKSYLVWEIQLGIDMENLIINNDTITTALNTACLMNKTVDLVNILLDYGSDIDKGNQNFNPPIVIALSSSRVDIARNLIYRGADLYKCNNKGRDAMYYAQNCGKKSLSVLQGLVDEMRNKLLQILPHVVSPDAVNVIVDYMFYATLKELPQTENETE